jgi:translation initiation factor 2 beta subunit (eIF-2beta)/eIF-5
MGGGNEKRNQFRDAFERGQKGEISNYEAWLKEKGVRPKRATAEYVTRYFHENPEEAPNHDDQLEDIAEFIGFFSERDGTYHIPIVGVNGIGKTQLLHTIRHMLESLGTDLPSKLYEAGRFKEDNHQGEPYWEDVLYELSELERAVVLVDNCYEDKRIKHSLEKISETVENSFIITTWTPEQWRMNQEEINEAVQVSKEAELTPLNEKDTVRALRKTLEIISEGSVEVEDEFYRRIYKKSLGIPSLFHTLLRASLKETFLKELELGDAKAVDSAVEKLDLDDAEERIYDLSEKKITILKHILLSRHPQGRRPSELVELMDKDKSTISYHLQNLISDRVLQKEKAGRSTFYSIHEPLKPILQLRVNGEGEIHA